MRQPLYLRQLRKDIDIWIENGWVQPEHRDHILATAGTSSEARSLVPIMMVVGAGLVGLGFLSFIAANWSGMEKLPRLILLFGSMWSAFGLALWARYRSPFAFEGLVLLGTILFGVNIMFVAQTYNINAHYPDGVLLWSAGAMVAALLIPSRSALALGFCLVALATGLEVLRFTPVLHVKFLYIWGPLALGAFFLKWRPGHHLAALSFAAWLLFSGLYLENAFDFKSPDILLVYATGSALAASLGLVITPPDKRHSVIFIYGYLILLFISWLLLFWDSRGGSPLAGKFALICATGVGGLSLFGVMKKQLRILDGIIMTALVLLLPYLAYYPSTSSQIAFWSKSAGLLMFLAWALSFGAWRQSKLIINYALVALGGEILFIYFSTFGGLLGNSAFFGISGVVFIASAFGLEKLRRTLSMKNKGEAHDPPHSVSQCSSHSHSSCRKYDSPAYTIAGNGNCYRSQNGPG